VRVHCQGRHPDKKCLPNTTECGLTDWFDTERSMRFDEEVIGLGKYGFTLTVLSCDALATPNVDEGDNEE